MRSALLASIGVVVALTGCADDSAVGAGGSGGAATGGEGGGGAIAVTGGGGAAPTCADVTCDPGSFCFEGACRACDAPHGPLHDQGLALGDDEEDRQYFLYVPEGVGCDAPAPLLVDFHGTAGGARPEEAYQLDALIALADAEGAIVVRPRSRSSEEGSFGQIYRWDQNPGDVERNVRFTENLVHRLHELYAVDPARTYATGFSSGSNMSAQFLDPAERGLFRGVAPIAGGVFSSSVANIAGLDVPDAPRLYLGTGYRDYLLGTQRTLIDEVRAAGLPEDKLWLREYNTGHDLYAWHFPELFAFLDRGERPVDGPPDAAWAVEDVGATPSFVAAKKLANGDVLASAADGSVWRRSVAGAWTKLADVTAGAPIAWTGLCTGPSGAIFLAGEGRFASSADGATWSGPSTVPELGFQAFGVSQLTSIACGADGAIVGVGYWTAVRSVDGGATWTDVIADAGGYEAQLATATTLDDGTLLAAGYYDFVGRGQVASGDVAMVSHAASSEWWNAVASSGPSVWLAGERGAVLTSADGGASWAAAAQAGEDDLYAAALFDAQRGAVAGRRGAVEVSLDGGTSFLDVGLETDRFVGAVVFLDAATILVLGERGLAATRAVP